VKAVRATNRFLRDLKLAKKRGKELVKIETVIDTISKVQHLAPKHRPHRLQGEMRGLWECHIEPDWLLIWDDAEDAIILVRTGTHADLFD